MRVVCPDCQAAYRIEADRLPLGARASARCRRCGARFTVTGEGEGDAAAPPDPVDRKVPAEVPALLPTGEPTGEGGLQDDPLGAGEALGFGWTAFKRHTGLLLAATVTFYLVQAVPQAIGDGIQDTLPWVAWLIYLAGWVATQFVTLGFLSVCLAVCDGRVTEYRDLFQPREALVPFLVGSVLYGLLCTLGLLLMVVPGIYWAVTHAFYGYWIAEGGAGGGVEALKRSAELTRGRKWRLLGLFCLLLGINILGVLPCGIGLLVTTPVSLMATAYAFRRLQGVTPRPAW